MNEYKRKKKACLYRNERKRNEGKSEEKGLNPNGKRRIRVSGRTRNECRWKRKE